MGPRRGADAGWSKALSARHCGRGARILGGMESAGSRPSLTAPARTVAAWVGSLPPAVLVGLTLAACLGLAALARLLGSSAWLWVTLAGGGFLVAYGRFGTRGVLLVGAALAGSGVGILFEGVAGWDGAYLLSVGGALAVADSLDPPPGHLVLVTGAVLAAIGLIIGMASRGPTQAIVVACLMAAAMAIFIALDGRRQA